MQLFSHTLSLNLAKLKKLSPLIADFSTPAGSALSTAVLSSLGAQTLPAASLEEMEETLASAQAVSIHLKASAHFSGSLLVQTAQQATSLGKPWVLDVASIETSALRRKIAQDMLQYAPQVIRGNMTSILALTAQQNIDCRDYREARSIEEALEPAKQLAQLLRSVVVITGSHDVATNGSSVLRVLNGHSMMAKIANLGAAVSTTIAGFLATGEEPFHAAGTTLGVFGILGEVVGEDKRMEGPSSFSTMLIDKMYNVDANAVMRRLKTL